LRKSFLVATSATLAVGVAGIAYAQTPAPAPTSVVKVAPSKAGTKSKPKASTLTLSVKNNDESKTTASQIAVTLPSTLKLSTKGLNQCTVEDEALLAGGATTLCKSSIAGKGEAHARLNPYSTSPAPINFKVTPLVGKNELLFYLEQTNGGVKALLHGKISGRKLTIKISPELQQPAPGAFSALSDLSTTLKAKKGKNNLLVSTGCTGGNHKVGVTITYVPNPTPPSKTSASAPAEAKCSK
jgi:hypothetical protein